MNNRGAGSDEKRALVLAAQKWRTTFDAISDMICLLDKEGTILQCNKVMAAYLTMPFSRIIGSSCCKLFHSSEKPVDSCPFVRLKGSLKRESEDIRIGERWINIQVDPILDDTGRLSGAVHVARDVTDRKKSEDLQRLHVHDMIFLSGSAMDLIELPPEKDIYQLIGEQLGEIVPAKSVLAVSEFDESSATFRARCITGIEPFMGVIKRILGKDPMDMSGDFGPVAKKTLSTGKLQRIDVGLHDFVQTVPESISHAIEKILGITGLYVIGFVKEGKILGGLSIILRQESALTDPAVIEAFATQAAIAIAKRKAEQALRDSENKYRELFDNAEVGMYRSKPDGTAILAANHKLCEIFGYTESELLGNPAVMRWADAGARNRMIEDLRKKGFLKDYGCEILTKDGEVRTCLISVKLHPDKGCIEGSLIDITERKRADDALRFLSTRQEALLSTVPEIVMEVDNNRVYAWANKSGRDFFGEDVIGKEAAVFFEGGQKTYETVQPLFGGGENLVYVESWQRRKDGEKRLLSWWCAVLKDKNGKITGALSSARDITEQRKAEDDLRHKTAFLEAQINSSIDGILVVDPNGKKILQNQQTVDLWKIPQHIADNIDDSTQVQHVMHLTKYPEQFVEKITYLYNHPNETSKDEVELTNGTVLERYSAPVLGKDGQNYGRIWMFHDITEHKRLEKERERLQSQLLQAQKMEAVGTLAGGVAHDFNNLLTAISGYTALAMAKIDPSNPVHKDLTQVSNAATKAAGVVRQLLLFGRRHPMESVSVNLNYAVHSLVKMLEPLIGEDITIEVDTEKELWPILGDEGSIEQVLMNLVVNARDAMPDGGKLSVKTENVTVDKAGRPGRFVCLLITDTGTGMDELTQERIFEPFFTTKPAGKGTGLGLSVVFGIVKQHEGWINVYSELGQGTTFKVYFPSTSDVPLQKSKQGAASASLRGNGERILLVEDHEELRLLANEILSGNGYSVFASSCAKEALALFEKENGRFDLVFTDVILPDKSGVWMVEELLKRVKIPVLFCSGYTDEKSNWDYIRSKNFRFLRKPYTIPDLIAAVRDVMGRVGQAPRREKTSP